MRFVLIWFFVVNLSGQTSSTATALYESHQWLALRESVRSTSTSHLLRGATASAFNETPRAISELNQALQSRDAYAAHELLVYVYWRSGRYRHALAQLDALLKMKPDAEDVKAFRKIFTSLAQFPEQLAAARKHSKLRYTTVGGNLFIPVEINGQAASYMVDTGANWPVISAAEARRRGLRISKGSGLIFGPTTASVEIGDVAMADQLTVGGFRLRNVAFLVVPDDRMEGVPSEQRGVLGLPVLAAFETLRWSSTGEFEVGFPSARFAARPNLYFDGIMPVTEVEFGYRKLDAALDTGAVETYLYPRFAKEFPQLLKDSGRPGTTHNVQVGGAFDLDTIVLPEVRLRVGRHAIKLSPARVIPKDIGSEWHYANLGMDALSQAQVVTIDFKSMTLLLDGP